MTLPATTSPQPMEEGRFSVIMPCYKVGRFIGEALESVGKQTHVNWEILAVDDCGPEDGTKEIVEAFAKRFPNNRVEYIQHEKNGGVSSARNTALAAARGEWAAFLDPDDLWLEHHLATGLDIFRKQPDVAVVTGPVVSFFEENGKRTYDLWKIPAWKTDRFPASLVYHNFIQPSATLVRNSLVKQAGGFDTTPELQHIEDYDLWIRLAELNARFVFTPAASCHYRKHAGAATSDEARMRRLHEELTRKHLHFFVRMQSVLLQKDASQAAYFRTVLKGPLMRLAMKLDHYLSRWTGRA